MVLGERITLVAVYGPVEGVVKGMFERDGVKYVDIRDKDGAYHVYPESRVK